MKKGLFATVMALTLVIATGMPVMASQSSTGASAASQALANNVTGVADTKQNVVASAITDDDALAAGETAVSNTGATTVAAVDLTYTGTAPNYVQVKLMLDDSVLENTGVDALDVTHFYVVHQKSDGTYEYIPLNAAGTDTNGANYIIFTASGFSNYYVAYNPNGYSNYTQNKSTADSSLINATANTTKSSGSGSGSTTHTHSYGTPTYTWASDGSTCVASVSCTSNDDTITENGTVTSAVKTAATCTTKGTTTYTATFTNSAFTTQTKDVQDIAALGHNFVNGVCSRCGEQYSSHTHDYTFQPATCTTPATCSCGATSGSALGHDYVNGICSRCGATQATSGNTDSGNGNNNTTADSTDDSKTLIQSLVDQIKLLLAAVTGKSTTNNYYTTANGTATATTPAAGTNAATGAANGSAVTSPKTGETMPVWPIVAVAAVAGLAFCGKRAYDLSERA